MDKPYYCVFRSTGVPDSYAARAQRRAVLVPLFGKLGVRQVPGAVLGRAGVLRRWRSRLEELAAAEWSSYGPTWARRIRERYYSMFNCRPTFIASVVRGSRNCTSCRASTICPFCWGRAAGDVYNSIAWALFDDPTIPDDPRGAVARRGLVWNRRFIVTPADAKPRRLSKSPFDLIERVTALPSSDCRFTLGRKYGKQLGKASNTRSLIYLIKGRIKGAPGNTLAAYGRPGEFARAYANGAFGAFERTSFGAVSPVEPDFGVRGRQGRWKIRFRQLIAVPTDWDDTHPDVRAWLDDPSLGFGRGEAKRAKWKRHRNPSRQEVAMAVGRTCAYDPILLRGDVSLVQEILDARVARRLSASCGVFRNGTRLPQPASVRP